MSIYTKLFMAMIWLGCILCICSLAEFIGLAIKLVIAFFVLRFVLSVVCGTGEPAKGATSSAAR